MPISQRLLCSAIVASLALTSVGCVTTGSSGGPNAALTGGAAAPQQMALTPAELKLREDKKRFDNTVIGGVVQGAMIGAAVGGLAVLLTGGDRKDAMRGAVAGAVAGGVFGGADGYTKAKLQQAKMNEVEAVQSAASDIRTDNTRLQEVLATSNAVAEEGARRLATLSADVKAQRISVAQAEAARKREEQNLALMRDAHKKAVSTRDQYAKASESFRAARTSNVGDMDREIERMNAQVAALERSINDYGKALVASRA